jgi:light-regulated signal transduction histidine kinase (bacteriophytochrome)
MVHTPTKELTESFKAPAIDLILLLGVVIAVLMGTLTFENWRAHSRARAAEKAERELAELNRNLEGVVDSRTRELANRNADLQTITDSVAHDLRNPLNTIAVNLELFELQNQGQLAPQALATLRRIPPGVHQMAEILERLLGFSLVAHKTFERKELNMEALAREVFADLSATDSQPPVLFTVSALPAARADEVLVKVLLTNLFSNALKFTRTRPLRRISVDFELRETGAVYTITDNGLGFDQKSGQRLFAAFERGREGGAADGLGLGLSIATRVVERHGGRIWAESVPGEKAVFHFTLEPDSALPA